MIDFSSKQVKITAKIVFSLRSKLSKCDFVSKGVTGSNDNNSFNTFDKVNKGEDDKSFNLWNVEFRMTQH